jgi:hypothetical protein
MMAPVGRIAVGSGPAPPLTAAVRTVSGHAAAGGLKSGIPGAVAQLGERCVRNAEVEGSTPFRSTLFIPKI